MSQHFPPDNSKLSRVTPSGEIVRIQFFFLRLWPILKLLSEAFWEQQPLNIFTDWIFLILTQNNACFDEMYVNYYN